MSHQIHPHIYAALAGFVPPVAPRIPYVEIVEPVERAPIDLIPTLGEREIAEFQRMTLAQGRAAAQRRRIAALVDAVPYEFPELKVVK